MLLEMRFLGGLAIQQTGVPLTTLKSQKGQALLCYLALTGKAHLRPALAGLLWPEMPDDSALMNLRHVLNQLKQHLAPHLTISRQSIGFNQDVPYWLDVAEFEAGVAADSDTGRLQAAVKLYGGDFLDGFYLADVAHFDEWVLAQRARLRELALAALHRLVTHFAAQAGYETAIGYARQQLAIEPWREEGQRELMRLLALSGQRSAALRQYETCRRILAEELAVAPSAETQALYKAIRAGQLDREVSGAARQGRKEEVFHFSSSAPPHNLPSEPTPLVGRETELEKLGHFLDALHPRLVTIVGLGGVGKTCLSLAAARQQTDSDSPFMDGVYFVSLAPLNDAAQLLPALARAVDFHFLAGDARPPQQQLLDYLQRRRLLLVLDNYEHLLPDVSLVASLLSAAPHLKLLVTARERLRVYEEQVFPLAGLAYSAGEVTEVEPAVQLFMERARRLRPDFALRPADMPPLTTICCQLEGMPLGLELAAAWVDTLSLGQIAAELQRSLDMLRTDLRNVSDRHSSLRAVFDASWQRLAATEQQLFARISVFRGGFTQVAAIRVTGASQATLASLVSKSLLRLLPSGRYNIHGLLRQFVDEKLQESAERVAAHDRHLAYFLTLAEEAEPHYQDSDQLLWLNYLEIEHNNLMVALEWAWEQEKAELAARLSGALAGFWGIRGYLNEGKRWLNVVLSQRQQLSAATLAQVLFASGWLAFEQGDYTKAKQYSEESLALWREVGDKPRTAKLLNRLGHAAQQQGDFVHTGSLYKESLALYQELGDKMGIALALNRLGHLAQLQGDDKGAIGLLEESLVLRRELDDKRGMASSLNALAEIARYQGDYQRAASLYEESLSLCCQLGDKRCIAGVCHNLGHVARHHGDFGRAVALFKESLTLVQELENPGGVALCLAGLAAVLGAQAQPERAAQLLGASEVLLEASSTLLSPTDKQARAQNLALVRDQLGEEAFAAAWAEGQAMSLEAAIAYALQE